MRLGQAMGCLGNAEIAVMRVGTQTVGLEVLVAIMADGDALFRARALDRRRARPLLASFFRADDLAALFATLRAGDF
jgi:hypothetical protein